MRTEEKISRIATACGWTQLEELPPEWLRDTRITGVVPDGSHRAYVPDYFKDLNAMHEAEKIIEQSCKEGDYWFYLREACGFPEAESDWSKCDYFAAVHATASKRAEAFGKALNLW